jgi:hypothetical protein
MLPRIIGSRRYRVHLGLESGCLVANPVDVEGRVGRTRQCPQWPSDPCPAGWRLSNFVVFERCPSLVELIPTRCRYRFSTGLLISQIDTSVSVSCPPMGGRLSATSVDLFGFDAGTGLPELVDFRDSPNLFRAGTFPMDENALRQRLTRSELILGNVASTISSFIESAPSPIAFVSFDLDLYSSTSDALKVFDASPDALLPRVYCYFDDTIGLTHSEFAGALLSISEYNQSHESRKIAQIRSLKHFVSKQFSTEYWTESFYLLHVFDHPEYNQSDGIVRAQRMDL